MRLGQLALFLLPVLCLHDYCNHALTPDGEALLAFKMGMKDSDGVLSQWKERDSDPCNWQGVTCDPQTKRVVILNLPLHRLWGYISPAIGKLDQLRRLGLHQNSILGTIPPDLGNCSLLKALYLRDNFLSGSIPSELGKLTELVILDISGNSLSGAVPASLGNLHKLSIFNVSTNFLVGEIPENGVLQNFTGDSFVGNLGLCGQQVNEICKSQLEGPIASPDSFSSLSPSKGFSSSSHAPQGGGPQRSSKYSSELLISALGTVGVSLLLALMCFWGCFLYHKFWRKPKSPEIDLSSGAKVVFFHGDLPYTSKEILRKIESLDDTNIIGYGGFGTVYKLVMDDDSIFAVKRIGKNTLGSDRLFERELEVLGSIKHRNLVNLRGYCNAPAAKLLIYDYLPNGNLDEILHDQDPNEVSLFNWAVRLKIAAGAARGLAYLHHDCSPRVIHRDIKSSNILLGDNLEPHVSDFGLAKLLEDNDSHVTTIVAGTFGYLAPEYLQSGRATAKADVYSYGVVLLELITGKRPNDASFVEKGLNIVGWVNSLIKEKNLKEMLDSRCDGTPMESLEAVLQIATLCIKSDPEDRLTMHQIVKMLEAEIMSPCPSEFYDSASD